MTPSARRYLPRVLILIGSVAVIAPLSWTAGEMFARRKAEAARRGEFEESRLTMEGQRAYFRVGSQFPSFSLLNAEDGSGSSLYGELPDGGIMIFVSPDCPNCEAIVQTIQAAIKRTTHARRAILVASDPIEVLREWRKQHDLDIPCFTDTDRFVESEYEYTVIPFMVLLTADHVVRENSTGGWSEDEYVERLGSSRDISETP